jgi:hypothetical protein
MAATDQVAVVAFFQRARVARELRWRCPGSGAGDDGLPAHRLRRVRRRRARRGRVLGRGTNDYLVEATVSVVAAYGSYVLGERAGGCHRRLRLQQLRASVRPLGRDRGKRVGHECEEAPEQSFVGLPPLAWRHVLFWGGLRGALPVVIVIVVTEELQLSFPLRDLVLGVVAVTLIVQGADPGVSLQTSSWVRTGGRDGVPELM